MPAPPAPATAVLPAPVQRAVGRYLRLADRLLPGRVSGLYVTGSVALGAYREARSDIDVVVVVDRSLTTGEVRRIRAVQWGSGLATSPPALLRGRLPMPGTVNATYVRAEDLARPVTTIVPVANHVGVEFHAGRGFDVNPVVWKTFADHGIAVRGPDASTLGLDPEPAALAEWNRRNLHGYWKSWAERLAAGRGLRYRLTPRWVTAWGVLGAPRLHHTIATGDVISKEAAGEYALATFDERWHPVIEEGLAYWREEPSRPLVDRWQQTAAFVLHVVADVSPPQAGK